MKAYPVEFRYRVVAMDKQGKSNREIREALGVSRAWVDSILRRHATGKDLAIQSSANKRTSLADREGDRIKARVAEHPGTTLQQLKDDLQLEESIWTIWHALRTLKLTFKKNASRQRTPTTGRRRKAGPVGHHPRRP